MQASLELFTNYSYSELEEITGVQSDQWSRYFNGFYDPSIPTLVKASNGLKCSPGELLDAIMLRRKSLLAKKQLEN